MRTVTFQSILHGVASLLGMDPARDLNAVRAATFTKYVNARLKEGWRYDFWPELMATEQRRYRLPYVAATAYVAPSATAAQEVYYIAAGDYFQTLRSTTGNAPATLTGVYVENSAYWARCAQSYSANDWAVGTVFAVGQQSKNPDDGRVYQCFTAHTAAGSSMDLTKFGVLTPFSKYIAYEQTGQTAIDAVKRVTKRDPRVYPRNPFEIPFTTAALGVQVAANAPAEVWVGFRLRPNQFTSTAWSGTTTYGLNGLSYVSATGECYVSLQAGNLNQNPVTQTAYWRKVDFPEVLASFVERAAFSDALKDQKQTDRSNNELEAARQELDEAVTRELESQGQYECAGVAIGN